MYNVYILLGSNLGNRKFMLALAISKIESCGIIEQLSPVYETKAWGFESNTLFLNQIVVIRTILPPLTLLNRCQTIEKEIGRKDTQNPKAYSSREIDLDILFYGEEIIELPELKVPHPLIKDRIFVLQPMVDLSPHLMHPIYKKTMEEMCCELLEKKPDVMITEVV